ncbi:MAG: hypothetical protein HQRvContig01_25 [Haloquadratum phage sp.]|nr:MAG: hypothetical protein HQRvContig01_25 [Haloquadratum phage sp.]
MPQFTASPKAEVVEHLKDKQFTVEVTDGHKTVIVRVNDRAKVNHVGGLFDTHGWITESINGDKFTFVPAGSPGELE